MYKLLLVDDNSIHLQSLLSYIEPEEFNISGIKIARDGYEAIEIAREFTPNVVITDISMPGIDGISLVKTIRKMNGNAQFIFISCYDDIAYFKSAIENNVLAYLMKPIIPRELNQALRLAIEKAALAKETEYSRQISRENLAFRLLHDSGLDVSYLHKATSALAIQNFNCFILVRVCFTDLDENPFQNAPGVKDFIFDSVKGRETILLPEGKQAVLLLFMAESPDRFAASVRKAVCLKLQEILDVYGVTAVAGASDIGSNLLELKSLYSQAEQALETNLNLLHTNYISYSDISVKNTDFNFVAFNTGISELIRVDVTPSEINQFVKQFTGKGVKYDEALLKELYLSAISSIQAVLLRHEIDISQVLGRNDVATHKVDRFSDMEQFALWLKNFLTLTCEYLKNYKGKTQFALVQKTISYIHKNYSTISSIEEIAANLFVSYSHLRNVFKKELGVTIYDFLLSVRMEQAKKLLTSSKMNLTQIAYKVGYSDYDYFKTVFAKYNGMTPREYQQMNGNFRPE